MRLLVVQANLGNPIGAQLCPRSSIPSVNPSDMRINQLRSEYSQTPFSATAKERANSTARMRSNDHLFLLFGRLRVFDCFRVAPGRISLFGQTGRRSKPCRASGRSTISSCRLLHQKIAASSIHNVEWAAAANGIIDPLVDLRGCCDSFLHNANGFNNVIAEDIVCGKTGDIGSDNRNLAQFF